MQKLTRFLFAALVLYPAYAVAHDTWVQTNTNVVRTGDACHVDLLLGNHGNHHRDFKMAGKASLAHATLAVIAPGGKQYDLRPTLKDLGYAPNEGFWATRFVAPEPGCYVLAHTLDQVMSYAPVRAVKSAKACVVATASLDRVSAEQPGFDQVLGHALELVPLSNPVTPMGPGLPINVRLLFQGKPLAGETVSFIPRGEELAGEFDERFERKTDDEGRANFTPTAGNYYLIVAHREDVNAKGTGYDKTKYSATFTVFVPQQCPCCEE
jgi:uncharacterized GH25 family protein